MDLNKLTSSVQALETENAQLRTKNKQLEKEVKDAHAFHCWCVHIILNLHFMCFIYTDYPPAVGKHSSILMPLPGDDS